MKRNHSFLTLLHTDLPVADAVVEAIVRLHKLRLIETDTHLTETEQQALHSAIRELKRIIQRNVC